mmetsp:Transcript_52287/g.147164  ORF Transcript_52287/g.147164 Transcript_52287/m.147164 type:complete len:214 (+) Transcript_52287:88-729(+)
MPKRVREYETVLGSTPSHTRAAGKMFAARAKIHSHSRGGPLGRAVSAWRVASSARHEMTWVSRGWGGMNCGWEQSAATWTTNSDWHASGSETPSTYARGSALQGTPWRYVWLIGTTGGSSPLFSVSAAGDQLTRSDALWSYTSVTMAFSTWIDERGHRGSAPAASGTSFTSTCSPASHTPWRSCQSLRQPNVTEVETGRLRSIPSTFVFTSAT